MKARGRAPDRAAGETLIVDNYDSFTYNLAAQVAEHTGRRPLVVRNDAPFDAIDLSRFAHVIISPGPGAPDVGADVGISVEILDRATVPVLGVCLGHELVATHFGGAVSRAREPVHGRVSTIRHTGDALFAGVPRTFDAVRYHSLAVAEVPPSLDVIASTHDGVVMALRHVDRPIWGVQFHPESILSQYGSRIVANFLAVDVGENDVARAARGSRRPAWDALGSARGLRRPARGSRRPVRGSLGSSPGWWVDTRRVRADLSPAVVHEALYKDDEHSFWLDSVGDDGAAGAMGSREGVLAHVLTYRAGSRTTVREFADGRRERVAGDIFQVVADELARFAGLLQPQAAGGFCLGYVGYLGYGLKADTCAVPDPIPSELPDARLTFVERAVVFDDRAREFRLLALRSEDDASPLDAASTAWLERTERLILGLRSRRPPPDSGPLSLPGNATLDEEFRFRHDRRSYLEKIRACQELIRAGESYQICLTNTAEFARPVDPYRTYRLLRDSARVPYGALLRCGDFSVLSASPECFLAIGADGCVETRPIKGTRPRGGTPEQDRRLKDELRSSEKERAENLMIVDLLRNDLNAVCRPGSVHVPRLFDVESFPSVHQLVSTVRGVLRPGRSAIDGLRAAFPGGSMTGAPKARTLRIIDELEEGPRGVYSGAIGWIALSGALELSVVIRTIVVERDRATFGVGGAITVLSDPDDEYEETLVKSRVVAAALRRSAATVGSPPAHGASEGRVAHPTRPLGRTFPAPPRATSSLRHLPDVPP